MEFATESRRHWKKKGDSGETWFYPRDGAAKAAEDGAMGRSQELAAGEQ